MAKTSRSPATTGQKENFNKRFAAIVCNNPDLHEKYTIQFFETAQKSNSAFSAPAGKSLSVLSCMTLEEAEHYRQLKI